MDEEQPQATLRETLQASIAEHTAEPVETTPAVTTTPAAAPVTAPETPEQIRENAAGRKIGPDGKFVSTKPEAAAPAAPAAVVTAEPAPQPIPRPSSWSKEMWPVWDKLNQGVALDAKEARQLAEYNAKRETQFASGVSTYKQIADTAKPLMEAIAPFQADLEKHGLQAPALIHSFMSAHRTLSLGSPQEKLQLFERLAQDYGIPLNAYSDQAVQQQFLNQPHTPQPAPQQDIAKLIDQAITSRELNQTVESMARDKEKYPFFQYVRPTMAELLQTGEATDLNDAYSKALERPEHAVFSTLQQQQQAASAESQRVANAQVVAKVARANTVSPKTATPAAAAPTGKQGVRDALREAIAQHAGGARV